jgi:hypothetical protein
MRLLLGLAILLLPMVPAGWIGFGIVDGVMTPLGLADSSLAFWLKPQLSGAIWFGTVLGLFWLFRPRG